MIIGIKLTKEEMELVRSGKIDPNKIEEYRKTHPVDDHCVDLNELDKVKQQIRETNLLYKQAIQRNKDLYEELAKSRKEKEKYRNLLAELRLRKKKILGIEPVEKKTKDE